MEKIFNDIKRIQLNDKTGNAEKLSKLLEEAGELAQSVNKLIGIKRKGNATEDEIRCEICEEIIDTIQILFSIAIQNNIPYEIICKNFSIKNLKWEIQLRDNIYKI